MIFKSKCGANVDTSDTYTTTHFIEPTKWPNDNFTNHYAGFSKFKSVVIFSFKDGSATIYISSVLEENIRKVNTFEVCPTSCTFRMVFKTKVLRVASLCTLFWEGTTSRYESTELENVGSNDGHSCKRASSKEKCSFCRNFYCSELYMNESKR